MAMTTSRPYGALLALPVALLGGCGGGSTAPPAAADSAAAAPSAPSDIRIDDTGVFPESVTSSADGTVYVGSVKGIVYRAAPRAAVAEPWIRPDARNGIRSLLGVLADDASGTLWLCSTPNFFGPEHSQGIASLVAVDLKTGEFEGAYPFPPPASVCNDITIAADGSAYVSDTINGRIFKLVKGANALTLYGKDPSLVGIDGLAFSGDGTLYVNNVRSNEILRVDTDSSGNMTGLTRLSVSQKLGGPDGFRLLEGNRFLQAEGTIGRLGILTIEGNQATLDVLTDKLVSSPGATPVGNTAYVLESNIRYLTDPTLKGKDPGPFMIYAVPMSRSPSAGEEAGR